MLCNFSTISSNYDDIKCVNIAPCLSRLCCLSFTQGHIVKSMLYTLWIYLITSQVIAGHEYLCTIIFYVQSYIYMLGSITNLPLIRYKYGLVHTVTPHNPPVIFIAKSKHPLNMHNSRFVIVISRFVFHIYHNVLIISSCPLHCCHIVLDNSQPIPGKLPNKYLSI